jgi:hypothetical protein
VDALHCVGDEAFGLMGVGYFVGYIFVRAKLSVHVENPIYLVVIVWVDVRVLLLILIERRFDLFIKSD